LAVRAKTYSRKTLQQDQEDENFVNNFCPYFSILLKSPVHVNVLYGRLENINRKKTFVTMFMTRQSVDNEKEVMRRV